MYEVTEVLQIKTIVLSHNRNYFYRVINTGKNRITV